MWTQLFSLTMARLYPKSNPGKNPRSCHITISVNKKGAHAISSFAKYPLTIIQPNASSTMIREKLRKRDYWKSNAEHKTNKHRKLNLPPEISFTHDSASRQPRNPLISNINQRQPKTCCKSMSKAENPQEPGQPQPLLTIHLNKASEQRQQT